MNIEKIKNYVLIGMFILCVFLCTQIWFYIPNFFGAEKNIEKEKEIIEINLWDIVRPEKFIIDSGENYTVFYNDEEYKIWQNTVSILKSAFEDESLLVQEISNEDLVLNKYIEMDFSSEIPIEIFLIEMKINIDQYKDLKNIKNIKIPLTGEDSIYLYNGEETIKFRWNNIDISSVTNLINNFDFSKHIKYAYNKVVANYQMKIPIPENVEPLKPIYVKSEIDINDYDSIEKIARDYFKEDYDYVRKKEESIGNINFVYKNEKVLKITKEGLLDFYDAVGVLDDENDIHTSLLLALEFTENFLGFPDDGFLNRAESIQEEGKDGFRFIFSYRIEDKLMLFSGAREEEALEIKVFGNKVVSYKRFIRDVDLSKQIEEEELKSTEEIIINLLDFLVYEDLNKLVEAYIEENQIEDPDMDQIIHEISNSPEIEAVKKKAIESIEDIYLAYFDLSTKQDEQLLRIVWVVKIGDTNYIFNAPTGKILQVIGK